MVTHPVFPHSLSPRLGMVIPRIDIYPRTVLDVDPALSISSIILARI